MPPPLTCKHDPSFSPKYYCLSWLWWTVHPHPHPPPASKGRTPSFDSTSYDRVFSVRRRFSQAAASLSPTQWRYWNAVFFLLLPFHLYRLCLSTWWHVADLTHNWHGVNLSVLIVFLPWPFYLFQLILSQCLTCPIQTAGLTEKANAGSLVSSETTKRKDVMADTDFHPDIRFFSRRNKYCSIHLFPFCQWRPEGE